MFLHTVHIDYKVGFFAVVDRNGEGMIARSFFKGHHMCMCVCKQFSECALGL